MAQGDKVLVLPNCRVLDVFDQNLKQQARHRDLMLAGAQN